MVSTKVVKKERAMNLKEEMTDMSDMAERYVRNAPVVYIDNAIEIAESYAKEKAWKAWKECNRLLCNVISKDATPLFIESMLFKIEFEKWWEENK